VQRVSSQQQQQPRCRRSSTRAFVARASVPLALRAAAALAQGSSERWQQCRSGMGDPVR